MSIQWKISPTESGFLVAIWEPAPRTPDRIHAFLYLVKRRVESKEEAMAIVREYKSLNNLQTVS